MEISKAKLILVGAGPGDEELITVKGINALDEANVVLYDALANKALLKYCRPGTKLVFVGKRAGLHHYQQFEINRMIVQYARKYGTVVRLKGGDPYVFGRGHEELEYARNHGLTVAVIPGISSAIAVPALHHIPLTRRGVSRSFTVVTATDKSGMLSKDLNWAASGPSTVVILMGMKKIDEITVLFKLHRGMDEPIAIIQNGSCPEEKCIMGTIDTIINEIAIHNIQNPAVIIIGAVVKEGLKEMANYQQGFAC